MNFMSKKLDTSSQTLRQSGKNQRDDEFCMPKICIRFYKVVYLYIIKEVRYGNCIIQIGC